MECSELPAPTARIFLLSPANCGGVRARQVLAPAATFDLAVRLRSESGAPLGEIFAFMSGLYFRGKLTYGRRFAAPPEPDNPVVGSGVLVITPNAGLRAADTPVTLRSFQGFAATDIDLANPAYRRPLEQGAKTVLSAIGPDCEVVLLGSIASSKYVDLLLPVFGDRLMFPIHFVGRGDMSRGGLLLRCVTAGLELEYVPLKGAIRHGQRPPKLEPIRHAPPAAPPAPRRRR